MNDTRFGDDEAFLDELERVVEEEGGAAISTALFVALDDTEAIDLLSRFSVTMHEDGFLILSPQPETTGELSTFVLDNVQSE
jgi:hypothetical protein